MSSEPDGPPVKISKPDWLYFHPSEKTDKFRIDRKSLQGIRSSRLQSWANVIL